MKKFLFDTNDFDKNAPQTEAAPTYTEEQLLLSREQGYAQGKADGLKESRQQQEEHIARALEKIAALSQTLINAEESRETVKCADTAKLALRVTHKLLPQFARRFALQEIEHVILSSLDARRDEPRIAVTVPTAHLEELKARMDAIALEKGYPGKVVIIADDNLAPTDCRVEWADGGAERLYERIYSRIESEFAKAIAGMQSTLDNMNKKK